MEKIVFEKFYFEKSVKIPFGVRLFEVFYKILFGKIDSNRIDKKQTSF
jgi:hypothetical protein